MNQGLFESLCGHYMDGTPVESVPKGSRVVRSIMDHLNRLFNTREGAIGHLPDYGLPDITEVYRKMPHGLEDLEQAIKRCLERYEPRLKNIRISHRDADPLDFKLVFIVSGELRNGGGLVRFQTTFTSLGQSSISPWKQPQ
jgi:type VI secretion system protein